MTKEEFLELIDELVDVYFDSQGGIGKEPNFKFTQNKVREGIIQLRIMVEKHFSKS